jgi:predicted nucleic acid-binding protein
MKIFIDTNILLDIYHLSGTDLEELRKVVKLVEAGKIELLVSQQVIDEFWRNREGVISDAVKIFRGSGATAKIPNIVRSYPESAELKKTVGEVNAIVKTLLSQVQRDIDANSLKADEVVNELFSKVTIGNITEEIHTKAQKRVDIGNPPGKKGSLGDAINWEWILEKEMEFWDEQLTIISGDGDFESVLTKGNVKEYLKREWNQKNAETELKLEKSLPEFLKKEFPDIQMAEQVDKYQTIEVLENSSSFATTHNSVDKLLKYDDFTDDEAQRIIDAYLSNNQIFMIVSDLDVQKLGEKIVQFAKQPKTEELAQQLNAILSDHAIEENEFEDIPF